MTTSPLSHVVIDGKKPCSSCGAVKPLEQFAKHHSAKSGYTYYCLACLAVKRQKQYLKHYDKTEDEMLDSAYFKSGGQAKDNMVTECGLLDYLLYKPRYWIVRLLFWSDFKKQDKRYAKQ